MPLHTDQTQHPAEYHCRWFPGSREQIAAARRFVTNRLQECPAQTRDIAVLLTSELATNAIEHTPSGFWRTGFLVLVIHTPGESVRIAVHDAGSWDNSPEVTKPDPDTERGRGLFLVDTLADQWGSYATPTGRKTWFDISL